MSDFFFINPYMESEPEPVLTDVFTDWLTNGIFQAMSDNETFTLPWAEDETIDSTTLDLMYFGNHSGAKFCAPLVKMLLEEGELSDLAIAALAKTILTKYNKNWVRLWNTYVLQYTPDNNYHLTESRVLSRDTEETLDRDVRDTHTGTDTLSHGLTVETEYDTEDAVTHGRTDTTTTYQYGFNEDDQNEDPADKSETVEGGTTSNAHTGTETKSHTGLDTTTKNLVDARTDDYTRDGSVDETETLNRTGKIGDRTIQSIISEDRELWLWNFFEEVFNNVDDVLALSVYDPCRV